MQSKMKPVWLNFENLDPLGDTILHIFKNGDGKHKFLFISITVISVLYIIDVLY